MSRNLFLVIGCIVLLSVSNVSAQENAIELDKIVVTSNRSAQEMSEAGSSISIISANDITNSNAGNTADILKSVPGIVVRNLFGNAAKTSIDLRGFGDMDAMNTLVLIDGRRVNEVDLSGVDWSQIPLDQIQKIEIVRGGNSILYGENAVAGVINIITKKGQGQPKIDAGTEIGSYGRNLEKIRLSGSKDKFSYLFSARREGSNGYRNNSFLKAYDYGSNLEYNLTDQLTTHFSSGFHRGSYGMPGALSESDMRDFGRRYAKNGDDRATDKDYYFMTGAKQEIPGFGDLSFDLSYRIKDVNSNLIGGNGGWDPLRLSKIDTFGFTPKLNIDRMILGRKNNLIAGFDFYRSLYRSDNLDSASALSNITRIHKDSLGGYIQDELFVLRNISAVGGFRYETVKYAFNYHDNSLFFPYPDIDSSTRPNEKAYKLGINYKYGIDSNAFINLSQNFRFPATDEFFNGTLNTSLEPQVSKDIEAGLRHSFSKRMNGQISLYRMRIKNELFTDPTAAGGLGATSNYDKTLHQGIDASADIKIREWLSFYGNYSYQDAEFIKNHLGGKEIPWVPNHKGTIGLRSKIFKDLTLNIAGNYIGERYRINDVTNMLPSIKSYFTTDLGVSYSYKDFTVSGNINNVFNTYYYEFATYGAFSHNKLYYPSLGRNFSLKLDYNF